MVHWLSLTIGFKIIQLCLQIADMIKYTFLTRIQVYSFNSTCLSQKNHSLLGMMDSFSVVPNKINWSVFKHNAQRWWLSKFIKSPLNTPWALPRLHLPWQHMAARNDTPTKHTKHANAHETIMTSYYNFAKLQNPHLSKHLTCQLLLFNCQCLSHALPLSLYQTINKHALKN